MRNVNVSHDHPVVVIDAGHYGKYNRSPVVPDYYESDMTWKLTNMEKTELEKFGIEVLLTRSEQAKDLSLSARGRASKDADLFESNHSNACDTESVDRPVGIYLYDDDCGPIDAQSKEITELLTETVREVMGTKGKAQTYSRKATKDRDGDGKKNDDYYGVLEAAHQVGTPALIMEHSFHTNKDAAKWLLKDENLQKLAAAKALTTARWFDVVDGVPVTPEEEKSAVTAAEKPQSGPLDSLKRTYKVTNNTLCVRSGAGTKPNKFGDNKAILTRLPKGTKVRCYGYYTKLYGNKWLYVQFEKDGVTYTGFASGKYLKKV